MLFFDFSTQLVYSLERLDKITGQKPETTHEENFQKYFGATIQKAIERLKMPVDATNPQKNWEPLKQVGMIFNRLEGYIYYGHL